MLEDINRVGIIKRGDLYREVLPVSPSLRINPQQHRQEDYPQPQEQRNPSQNRLARRRFTAIRELIEKLIAVAPIIRVDYNTANQELTDLGLSIAEEKLIDHLLRLKIPLDSIDDLVRQLQLRRSSPSLVSGRALSASAALFPVFVADLNEYLMRFDNLQIASSRNQSQLLDVINEHGHFLLEEGPMRLNFSRATLSPALKGDPLNLTVSIRVGAIETDDNGRRAIFYQRLDQSYGLYSDKSISLSI